MPGAKDFVTTKNDKGDKIKIQKRLLLGPLREIYAILKERDVGFKVGFSTFAILRPIQCVFVKSAGTHTVCVCTIHQNVKLSILGIKFVNIFRMIT